jgi:hypothetical protein
MLGSNWLWDRVGYRWMVSTSAACLYGAAVVFVCLGTAFWFDLIAPNGSISFLQRILWGLLGVLAPLSMIFLWTGMRRYQEYREVRDPELVGRSRVIRLLLSVGIWYGAMIYYLVVYLPARHHAEIESFGEHVS